MRDLEAEGGKETEIEVKDEMQGWIVRGRGKEEIKDDRKERRKWEGEKIEEREIKRVSEASCITNAKPPEMFSLSDAAD